MDVFVADWLNLILRWAHLVVGIGWIGTSFYFIALDLGLRKNPASPAGVFGEQWQVHGGGFYHIQKYLVAPDFLPEHLTWFKWESYWTWMSGFILLAIVYYAGAGFFVGALPLLRDLLSPAWLSNPMIRLLPRRGTAIVGAPAATFSYGHWDLLPLQFIALLAVMAMGAWSRAAFRRGYRFEGFAFATATATVVTTQLVFLALGPAMTELPDSTEYRELFIALGLAWYAFLVATEWARAA